LSENGVMDLVGTTSSISFTQPTTFGRRHHSPPYSILCAFPWGLHLNVTFLRDSQVDLGVPKLGFLLSQNFGCSYFFQIKYILRMRGQYLIALKNIFSMMYNTTQLDFVWPLISRGLWLGVQIPNLIPTPSFDHNSCKSCLNEQYNGTLSIYVSKPF